MKMLKNLKHVSEGHRTLNMLPGEAVQSPSLGIPSGHSPEQPTGVDTALISDVGLDDLLRLLPTGHRQYILKDIPSPAELVAVNPFPRHLHCGRNASNYLRSKLESGTTKWHCHVCCFVNPYKFIVI
ncbi:hypothetical protein llap_416 [Limosa lapponica baueri]|uniref:Uncharacterized protein n=1 Tax=Limosa lapponica baueri TaxID=1758121 RepID=A0A2I0UT56_LIMLA|nr:hypothetical protein llap_416 [Limosa lapponica baueri]